MFLSGGLAALAFTGFLAVLCCWLCHCHEHTPPSFLLSLHQWLKNAGSHEPWMLALGVGAPLMGLSSRILAKLRAGEVPVEPQPFLAERTPAKDYWSKSRKGLIHTVGHKWEDYLKHNLYDGHSITPEVEESPELIGSSPYQYERAGTATPLELKDSTRLKLFDDSGGLLLIVGKPGGGKTITLLQLNRQLLDRAVKRPAEAVPVVVPLASWAAKGMPLEQWLAGELNSLYILSPDEVPGLLAEQRLILLLDGLDEVREDARNACLQAIQTFREKPAHAGIRMVVCCREEEYKQLADNFKSGDAIRLRDLSPEWEAAFFQKAGKKLDPLRDALKNDAGLRELATTPLMFFILARVFGEGDITALLATSGTMTAEQWRPVVYRRYVELMFLRKEEGGAGPEVRALWRNSPAQAVYWLQQIAKRLTEEDLYTLYLENILPTWVRSSWRHRLLAVIISALAWGLSGGLLVGVAEGERMGWLIGLVGACVGGLAAGVGLTAKINPGETKSLRFQLPSRQLLSGVGGLFLEVSRGVFAAVWRGLLGIGAFFGLVVGIYAGPREGLESAMTVMASGAVGGVFGTMLLVMFFKSESFPEPLQPNQTMWRSFRQALFAALLAGGAGMILAAFGVLPNALLAITPMIGWLIFGGDEFMNHYALRLALAWEGTLPYPLRDRRLIAFLDAMRDRLLLIRIGGGWDFRHRELQEYLAKCPFGETVAEVEKNLHVK